MLLTVKNKQRSILINQLGKQTKESIVMQNASVNFTENMSFMLVVDASTAISNLQIELLNNDGFVLATRLTGGNATFTEFQVLTEAVPFVVAASANYNVYQFNVAITQEEERLYKCKLHVKYDTTASYSSVDYTYDIACQVSGVDDKYIVLCQNFKFDITDDYYNAFKASEHRSSGIDERLMNEKRKEFLLNYFDLDAEIGTYKTLLAALAYFGYGDLLSISELWKNDNDVLTSTPLSSAVLDFVDNRLSGFNKTNQLQLVYKINDEDGTFDNDGLPNYVTELFDTDEMLVKMHALRRALEKDFMPLNTKIVDIIGEHTSNAGIDSRIWLDEQRIDNVDLNTASDVTLILNSTNLEIRQHEVLLDFDLNIVDPIIDNDMLSQNIAEAGNTGHFADRKIFQVSKELIYDLTSTDGSVEDAMPDEDYLYARRYYRGDFALVKFKTAIENVSSFRRWNFEVYDLAVSESVAAYTSLLKDISTLQQETSFGIRKIGQFKMLLYLFDGYGGVSVVNDPNAIITITKGNVDFKLARIDRSAAGFEKNIDLFSTFEIKPATDLTQLQFDLDKTIVVDAYDATLDVNTFNENTNTNAVLRYNTSRFNTRSMFLNSFEFNLIAAEKLVNTRLYDYGYEYMKRIVDLQCLTEGSFSTRAVGAKVFQHDVYEYIEVQYDVDSLVMCKDFVNQVNLKPTTSVWSRFTVTIDKFSIDGMSDNWKYVIKIVGKEVGESLSNTFFRFKNFTTPVVNSAENYISIMPFSAYLRLVPTTQLVSSELYLKIGTDFTQVGQGESTRSTQIISSVAQLATTIRDAIAEFDGDATVFEYDNEVIISSRHDITVRDLSVGGTNYEIARGKESATLKICPAGDTIWLGEPFYAYPDLSSKIELLNCKWTLSNALTGEILDIQNSYVYRNILISTGSYTLTLDTIDMFGTNHKIKNGFVTVAE